MSSISSREIGCHSGVVKCYYYLAVEDEEE